MTRLEILQEVYGNTEWSESALTSLMRVMELTREDERIRQMKIIEDHHDFLVDSIVHLCLVQHQAAKDRHNHWLVAANLIKAEFTRVRGFDKSGKNES
jgi:hypothetical protein